MFPPRGYPQEYICARGRRHATAWCRNGGDMHWSWFRIVAAITGFSGVVAGFIVNVDRAARQGHGLDEVLANYFSLFTIISTLLAVVTLLVAASWGMRHAGTEREPLGIALALAAVTGPVLLLG